MNYWMGQMDMEVPPHQEVRLEINGKLTKRHGDYVKKSYGHRIRLSPHVMDSHGWVGMKETIRHELIHLQQRLDGDEGGHGESFKKHMDAFNVSSTTANSPARDPQYTIMCVDCGHTYTRQRKSKIIKKPELYSCHDCGGDLTRTD